MAEYRIKSIHSVDGDWFCIEYDYHVETFYIERVALWALIDKDGEMEHIAGIDSSGLPFPERLDNLGCIDQYYVLGSDLSPDGRSWAEIYASIVPSIVSPLRRFPFPRETA